MLCLSNLNGINTGGTILSLISILDGTTNTATATNSESISNGEGNSNLSIPTFNNRYIYKNQILKPFFINITTGNDVVKFLGSFIII